VSAVVHANDLRTLHKTSEPGLELYRLLRQRDEMRRGNPFAFLSSRCSAIT